MYLFLFEVKLSHKGLWEEYDQTIDDVAAEGEAVSRFPITTPGNNCDLNNCFYHIHSRVKDLMPLKQRGFPLIPPFWQFSFLG